MSAPVTTASSLLRCAACRRLFLALSDERDRGITRTLAGERRGYGRGYADGFAAGELAGRAAEIAEQSAAWQVAAGTVLTLADPNGPEARASVNRRLAAALAGERRDAAEHWGRRWAELLALAADPVHVRAALAVRPEHRSYEQAMTVLLASERSAQARRGAA